jgi:hypothetical protein
MFIINLTPYHSTLYRKSVVKYATNKLSCRCGRVEPQVCSSRKYIPADCSCGSSPDVIHWQNRAAGKLATVSMWRALRADWRSSCHISSIVGPAQISSSLLKVGADAELIKFDIPVELYYIVHLNFHVLSFVFARAAGLSIRKIHDSRSCVCRQAFFIVVRSHTCTCSVDARGGNSCALPSA